MLGTARSLAQSRPPHPLDQDMWRLEDRIEGSEHLANRGGSEQRQEEEILAALDESLERENQGKEVGETIAISSYYTYVRTYG